MKFYVRSFAAMMVVTFAAAGAMAQMAVETSDTQVDELSPEVPADKPAYTEVTQPADQPAITPKEEAATAWDEPAEEDDSDEGSGRSTTAEFLKFLREGPAKLKKGSFEMDFHARIQAWGGWVGEDSLLSQGDRMQEYGFRLRRARFGIEGQLVKKLNYKLELDLFDQEKSGGPLYEAWINYEPTHFFGLTVGLNKFLYSREEMLSSGGLTHLDRSVASRAMAPGGQMGLMVYSHPVKDKLSIAFGVYNGLQRRASFFEGYEGVGTSLGNKFERLAYVGRIDASPMGDLGGDVADLKNSRPLVGFGAGAMYSNGKTAEIIGASGYAQLKASGFHLLAEVLWDRSSPQADPSVPTVLASKIDRLTFAGSLGYVIPKVNLGLAVRSEYIDDNMNVKDEGDVLITAATVTYYACEHFLKVLVEYQNRYELHGRSISNDAAIAGVQLMF